MSHTKPTIAELTAQVARLEHRNLYLSGRLAEAEEKLGTAAPILTEIFHDHPVRLMIWMDHPYVFANDVVKLIKDLPRAYVSRGRPITMAHSRFLRLGLGHREIQALGRSQLAASWSLTERNISRAFGVSTRAHFLSFITSIGIETLRDRAPEFCGWIEREAFPKVIERFGKGGAT